MSEASLYSKVTLAQATDLIAAIGHTNTVLVQGEMGIGKSAILKELAKRFPNHYPCYVDITTKDVGDFIIPKIKTLDGVDVCEFVPNVEFGFHFKDRPIIMMLDELGKAKGGVMNACLRLMHERCLGMYKLVTGSIVFATTNLTEEGLGDSLPPHARNRITTVRAAKPTVDEWIQNFAIGADIDPVIIATVNEYPQMLASYEEFEKPEQNAYIYHPKASRASFVTHRALANASNIYKQTRHLGNDVMAHALAGTVGKAAMHHILTMATLDMELPSWEAILNDPENTPVSTNAAAACLLVMKAVQRVEKETMGAWMTYLKRMTKETQGLFARSIVSSNCPKAGMASNQREFTQWVVKNGYLFKRNK